LYFETFYKSRYQTNDFPLLSNGEITFSSLSGLQWTSKGCDVTFRGGRGDTCF
jgi:hypothetical protein